MDTTAPRETFDSAYESGAPPWVIGQPQPAIVALERDRWLRGRMLDTGCGTGEHTIHLARLGYDVEGIDSSARAVELARRNADDHGVSAQFEVADALALHGPPRFDTVIDSALFHVFGPEDRARYARALHEVCKPDGLVHVLVLALSDEPGFGPRISDAAIREAFTGGWDIEQLRSDRYRVVAHGEHSATVGVASGTVVDLPAWLARIRRRA
jgi:SAM-dependent methyltransferase